MDIVSDISDVVKEVKQIFQIFLMFPRRSYFPTYSYSAGGVLEGIASGVLPVYLSSVGAWRVLWASCAALVMASGVWAGRPLSWLCVAVAGRGAVLLPGPVSWPGVVSSVPLSIVAGAGGALVPVVCGGGRSAVQRGRVCLLCMVPGLGCVLRSACLGCWRRPWLGSWRRAVLFAVLLLSGSCFRSGLFPNCIAGFRDDLGGFSGADAPVGCLAKYSQIQKKRKT